MKKIGVIINNIGTPESYRPKEVGKYLSEFLMDPDVISIPFVFRFILVKGLIVPLRKVTSGKKYESIWTENGSPLMVHSKNFASKLQAKLGDQYVVRLGMRYGKPSLQSALEEFKDLQIDQIILAPMFPQYAEATTGSAEKKLRQLANSFRTRFGFNFKIKNLSAFYDEDFFLSSKANLIRESLVDFEFDHVVFSYHGLPESQLKKQGCPVLTENCISTATCIQNCYKHHCHQTSISLAKILGLSSHSDNQWTTSFQSRLGPTKWIGPATNEVISKLAKDSKKVAVVCPAFVADCLETLEEIAEELKEQFLNEGGAEFKFIPCLNDRDEWVEGFAKKILSMQ